MQPDHELALHQRALLKMRSGDWEAARKQYESLTRLYPHNPSSCVQLARIAMTKADAEAAGIWLRHALARGGEALYQDLLSDPELAGLLERITAANDKAD